MFGHTSAKVCTQSSEDNFVEVAFSVLLCMCSGDRTLAVRLACQALYLWVISLALFSFFLCYMYNTSLVLKK